MSTHKSQQGCFIERTAIHHHGQLDRIYASASAPASTAIQTRSAVPAQVVVVPLILLWRHRETEVNATEEVDLQRIQLRYGDAADLSVVRVGEIDVIEKLRREHKSRGDAADAPRRSQHNTICAESVHNK